MDGVCGAVCQTCQPLAEGQPIFLPFFISSLCVCSICVSPCVSVASHVTIHSSFAAALLQSAGGHYVAGVCRDISVASHQ